MGKFLYPIYKLPLISYEKWWLYNSAKKRNGVLSDIIFGSDLILENSLPKRFKIFDILGNTFQKSYLGKNLLDYKTVVPATSETVTLIDNGFKVNGNYAGKIVINNLKPNTDYYLQYITENIVGTIKQVVVFGGTEADSSSLLKTILNGTGGTFNTGSYTTINIWFYAGTGTKGEANFTNIQLEEGTTATSYEPYCRTEYQPQIHLMKYQFIM